MTRTGEAARPPVVEERAESFLDWFQHHTRLLIVLGVLVLAGGVGSWLYVRSQQIRSANAERSLMGAQQALAQNNIPLARNDLQQVVTRYSGTAAATQAALLLAQIHYDAGEHREGIEVLERVRGTRGARGAAAAIEALIAAGLEDAGDFGAAARHFERAAEESRFDADRATYRASAARAFASAGDREAAIRIWRELAEDEESQLGPEARVRLGELIAQPAGAS